MLKDSFTPKRAMTLRIIGHTAKRAADVSGDNLDANVPYKLMYLWNYQPNACIERVDKKFYPGSGYDDGINYWIVPISDLEEWKGEK